MNFKVTVSSGGYFTDFDCLEANNFLFGHTQYTFSLFNFVIT